MCYTRARLIPYAADDPAVCADLLEFLRDPRARARVAEGLGPDSDEIRAGVEQVAGVAPALHPAHADDRQPDALAHLAHLRERDRADGRARHPAGAAAEPRLAGPARVDRHSAQRVDERDGVRAVLLGGGG